MIAKIVSRVKDLYVAGRRFLFIQSRRAATSPHTTIQTLNNSFLILSSAVAAALIGVGMGSVSHIDALFMIAFGIGSSLYALHKDFPVDIQSRGPMLQG